MAEQTKFGGEAGGIPESAERFYSILEIAERWRLSQQTVRPYFENEPGVIRITGARPRGSKRRGRVTLRVPESVLDRVYRKLSGSN